MIKFLKNLLESLAAKKSQQDTACTYKLPEYSGPREFANKPAVDYLLKHAKYKNLPELAGRAISFQSLFTIDEDIQKALKNDYPYIDSLIVNEELRAEWNGCPIAPKYIFLAPQRMQVDFQTTINECNPITLDDLEYLGFLDQKSDDWLHNTRYNLEALTLDDLGRQLDPSSKQIYLHLIIDNGQPWNQNQNEVKDKLGNEVITKLNRYAANESVNFNPFWQAIIEVYNDKFFPAELVIREACLTNFHNAGQSCVYSHRYFYF